MSNQPGLFDDEDEAEYQPEQQQQEQQMPPNPYANDAPTEQQPNPYANDAPVEQQQELFNGQDEEEYQPLDQEPAQNYNQYGQQEEAQHPIGFGAERQNLMQEQQVEVTESTATGGVSGYEETKVEESTEKVDIYLKEQAENAKNKLLTEINAFNEAPEVAAVSEFDTADQVQESAFTVRDPVAVGSVIKYTVSGQDSKGAWQVQRRYNEFESLRAALVERWPGCYIPSIPEKVTVNINIDKMSFQGNKDAAFVEERRALLERLIREICNFDYLIESKEFQIFAHGSGEVTKILEDMPKQTPTEILERYRLNFSLDEDQTHSEVAQCKEKINVFSVYLKKAVVQLEKQQEIMYKYSQNQNDSHKHYQRIYYNFLKYEDDALDFFAEQDRTKRILTHPDQSNLPADIVSNINSWKKSVKDVWVFLKGENLEVKGMIDAMNGREKTVMKLQKAEERKRDKQTELDKMSMGKTTLKSFFKTKSTIEKDILNYQSDIEQLNIDIEEYRKLINFITIYQGQLAIEKFKRIKVQQYMKMLNSMAVKEISNAHLQATLAHSILVLSDQAPVV